MNTSIANFPIDLNQINWGEIGKEILQWPYFWPTLILIFFLFYIWRKIKTKNLLIKLSDGPTGSIEVSRKALVDLIQKTIVSITPKSQIKVCIHLKQDKLYIKIKLNLQSDQNLEMLASKIQSAISSILREYLGLENIGTIDIIVSGFQEKTKTPIQNDQDF